MKATLGESIMVGLIAGGLYCVFKATVAVVAPEATPPPTRPAFQTDDLTHVLNRLHQLRLSWEHRHRIIVGEKGVMQRLCLDELTTEMVNIEAALERAKP